jgi:hypothetical protein
MTERRVKIIGHRRSAAQRPQRRAGAGPKALVNIRDRDSGWLRRGGYRAFEQPAVRVHGHAAEAGSCK